MTLFCVWVFFGLKSQLTKIHPLEFHGNPAQIFSAAIGAGSVYLASPVQGAVLRFDDHGKALPPIGRKGQGPGEFNWPSLVYFEAPFLYVCDNNQEKIYRVDPINGRFLKQWSIKGTTAMAIKGDALFAAFVDPQKERVFGIASLKDDLKFQRLLGDAPCCLAVSGSHKAAVLRVSDGTYWTAFTGEYKLQHYSSNGDLIKSITRAPLDYVVPSQKKDVSRYDTTALSENVRSFDKMNGLFEYGELILLYRFKTRSNSAIDVYTKSGVYRATFKSDELKPVDVVGGKLFVLKETPEGSQWDIELYSLSLSL